MEVLIGVDPHKARNAVAAIDEQGELVGQNAHGERVNVERTRQVASHLSFQVPLPNHAYHPRRLAHASQVYARCARGHRHTRLVKSIGNACTAFAVKVPNW